MNSLPAMPHYMNQLAEYAYNNFLHKGLALEKTRYTTLTVTIENGNAVFKQKAEGSYGRKHFSCWRIFNLAKMIQDESKDTVSMLKVRIEFDNGLVTKVKYNLVTARQE